MPGADMMAAQLAAWEKIAEGWEWFRVDGSPVDRCVRCGHGMVLAEDSQGRPYRYTHEQYLALVVLHLRNHHADLDPNV